MNFTRRGEKVLTDDDEDDYDLYSFVQTSPRPPIFSFSNSFCLVVLSSNAGTPVFRSRIVPMEINVGAAVRFECEVEETPEVSFTWFKDGDQVREGHKYAIISGPRSSCLEILQPIKEDSGEYTCKASNQHGADECSAPLTVTGKNTACFLSPG